MNVRELQDALRKLENVYELGGSKKQAGSVAAVVKSIDGDPDLSVDELIAQIRRKLSASEGDAADVAARKPEVPAVVDQYARRLAEAGTDRSQFDELFAKLKSDPAAKAVECFAIANRYKNDPIDGKYVFKFGSKREALDFIFDTYIGRAQAESKAGIIDRITKWAVG